MISLVTSILELSFGHLTGNARVGGRDGRDQNPRNKVNAILPNGRDNELFQNFYQRRANQRVSFAAVVFSA